MHKKFIIFLLFVCITCVVDVYAVAINEICNTSSDCDYGLFCKSQPNQPTSPKTCTVCDKPDNATFTGHGSDDDENSCPWKCIDINDKCNGFHQVDDRCVANKQDCTDGFQVWDKVSAKYSDCYITAYASNQILIENGTLCDVSHGTLNSCIFAIHL